MPHSQYESMFHSMSFSNLPTEILIMIFKMLDNAALANVVSVCSRWRELGEGLWKWGTVGIDRSELIMLGIKRLEHVKDIMIEIDDWSEEELVMLFEALKKLSKLTYLDMWGVSLKTLDPNLFAQVVTNIEEVIISKCELTESQLNLMFGVIGKSSKLESLQMEGVDSSLVDAETLAAGVNQLKSVNLYKTQLGVQQVTELLREAGKQTTLLELFLDSNRIDGDPFLHRVDGERVNEDIVEKAKQNIGELHLNYCFEFNSQWSTFRAGSITCYVTSQ